MCLIAGGNAVYSSSKHRERNLEKLGFPGLPMPKKALESGPERQQERGKSHRSVGNSFAACVHKAGSDSLLPP